MKKKYLFNLSETQLIIIVAVMVIYGLAQFGFSLILGAIYPVLTKAPTRSVVQVENLMVSWNRTITEDMVFEYSSGVIFFNIEGKRVVYPTSNALNAINILTGETIWKVATPPIEKIVRLDNTLFITTSGWSDIPDLAPISTANKPECAKFGTAGLFSYNVNTGEKRWGYRYYGASSDKLAYDDKNIYLDGSSEHATLRSMLEIDRNLGNIKGIYCNAAPNKYSVPLAPVHRETTASTYKPFYANGKRKPNDYDFSVQGNKIIVINGVTKKQTAFIEFSGKELATNEINIVNQKNIVLIYLNRSHQLFGIRLAY